MNNRVFLCLLFVAAYPLLTNYTTPTCPAVVYKTVRFKLVGSLTSLPQFNENYPACNGNISGFSTQNTPGLQTYTAAGWSIYIGYYTQALQSCAGNLNAESIGYNVCSGGVQRRTVSGWGPATNYQGVDDYMFQIPVPTNRNSIFNINVFSPCGPCAANNYPNFINNSAGRWIFNGRTIYAQNVNNYSSSIPIPMKLYLNFNGLSLSNSYAVFGCAENGGSSCWLF